MFMPKKIRIKLRNIDRLEFTIDEDAKKDDFFSLKDVNEIDFSEIEKIIKDKENAKLEELINKEKKNWENNFRLSNEYKALENEIIKLKNHLEINKRIVEEQKNLEFEKGKSSIRDEYQNKINELNKKINDLENQKRIDEERKKSDEERKESDKKISQLEFEKILQNKENEFQKKLDEIQRNRPANSKVIGEDLENWISNKYSESFGMLEDCSFEKTTKALAGTKPDFEFKVFDPITKVVLTTVILEAKSESLDETKPKTKNSEHFDRLEENRKKWKADYALLVTELEKKEEFAIKKIQTENNVNSYLVRPDFFTIILSIIRSISLAEKDVKQIELNLKSKQDLIKEFENLKIEILDNSVKNINNNLKNILDHAEKIMKLADNIKNDANIALNRHLETIRSKIEKFKIQSIAKKAENLENNNNNQ